MQRVRILINKRILLQIIQKVNLHNNKTFKDQLLPKDMRNKTNEPNENPIRRAFETRLSIILGSFEEGMPIPEQTFVEYAETRAEMFRSLADLHHPGHRSDHYHQLARQQEPKSGTYSESKI